MRPDRRRLNYWKKMRLIILPQAIRVILPAIGNQFVYMLKMSSLVSVIGLTELTRRADELVVSQYRPLEIYTFLVLEYFLLIICISTMSCSTYTSLSIQTTTNNRKIKHII